MTSPKVPHVNEGYYLLSFFVSSVLQKIFPLKQPNIIIDKPQPLLLGLRTILETPYYSPPFQISFASLIMTALLFLLKIKAFPSASPNNNVTFAKTSASKAVGAVTVADTIVLADGSPVLASIR